ncbi:MAG TPA: hypothetical protein PK712_07400 [Rectinema sp.]|jgi:hypothetical protein|nr:hypothetical protein [Rectinema sp.]
MKKVKLQITSKDRVTDFAEVLTSQEIVTEMLDLVKLEAERIDSRFLEPACGTGNFLIDVLKRKLLLVFSRYSKSQIEYERYALLALSSIYGIDILQDNVEECRHRLFDLFNASYTQLYSKTANGAYREAARYILKRNIIHGDALSLKTVFPEPQPIVFSEWSFTSGSMLKRRDFAFHELLDHSSMRDLPLFSDQGEEIFIPEPIKEFPQVHYLEVAHAYSE